MSNTPLSASDRAAILVAHYQAARDDIREKTAKRDQYVQLWATGVVVVFGFAATQPKISWVFIVVPFITLITSIFYASSDLAAGLVSRWLSTSYEEEMKKLLGVIVKHWDSAAISSQERFEAAGLRYAALAVIFLISIAAAFFARLSFLEGAYLYSSYFFGEMAAYGSSAFAVVAIVTYNANRRRKMIEHIDMGSTSG